MTDISDRAKGYRPLEDEEIPSTQSNSASSRPTHPYDHGHSLRVFTIVQLSLALVAGLAFGAVGINFYDSIVVREYDRHGSYSIGLIMPIGNDLALFIRLLFMCLTTLLTEAAGTVHAVALRWALAREGRLVFSANLRLFNATRDMWSITGRLASIVFGIALITAYVCSASMFICIKADYGFQITVLVPLPWLLLGVIFVVQACMCLFALSRLHVPTWSSNPLDVVPALLDHGHLKHEVGRCMRSAADANIITSSPITPSRRQPSASACHPSVRRILYIIWTVAGLNCVWAIVMVILSSVDDLWMIPFPTYLIDGVGWVVLAEFALAFTFHAMLALWLHCCELVVTLAKDEATWRAASPNSGLKAKMGGAEQSGTIWSAPRATWPAIALFMSKPVLHWLFSNAVGPEQMKPGISVPLFAGGMLVIATFVTYIAKKRPLGAQPAAYGHIQTLANLVDEWSPKMYWGHKEDGIICHAGTSAIVLPDVDPNRRYAC